MGYIELFILSMIPIIELRAAIPLGIAMELNPLLVYISCVLGATVVSIPLILTCRYIIDFLKAKKVLTKLTDKIDKKIESAVEKMGNTSFIGLLLFVAIPMPSSGTWTASMIVSILKLRLRSSLLSIFLGNMVAGAIMIIVSMSLN